MNLRRGMIRPVGLTPLEFGVQPSYQSALDGIESLTNCRFVSTGIGNDS
jgi:hypothetical protein